MDVRGEGGEDGPLGILPGGGSEISDIVGVEPNWWSGGERRRLAVRDGSVSVRDLMLPAGTIAPGLESLLQRASNACLLFVIAFLLLGGEWAWAQQSAQAPPSQVLHKHSAPPARTIFLDVLVTEKNGQPVTGLGANDFTVLDDKRPEKITSFKEINAKEQPVEAIVLIDAVNTHYDIVSEARQQIDKFLHANGGKLPLPTVLAVLTNDGIEMQHTYTTNGNDLDAVLTQYTIGLREIRRSAGVYGDAERLDDSLKAIRLLAAYELQRPGRKIILWIAPGWPLLSGPEVTLSYDQTMSIFNQVTWLSSALREGQVTVYSIDPLGVAEPLQELFYYQQFLAGLKKPGEAQLGNLGLQVLATQSGGKVLNSPEVADLLTQCMAENQDYYRISFEPPASELGEKRKAESPYEYHALKVLVAHPGVTAATSTGYYIEP
ncbi:MAG: VWA domain-containing protein [Acidobacteriaceae bacterium]